MWKEKKILDNNSLDEGQGRNKQCCEWEEIDQIGIICVWEEQQEMLIREHSVSTPT